MASVVAIRHVAFEDAGILEELFAARGWSLRYVEVPLDGGSDLDPLRPDLLIVLGGPISANDEASYPFLASELQLIERRLAADKPTLGICLGAQLIARCLGASVVRAPEKEIGWEPLLLNRAAYDTPIRHLAAEHTFLLHWHGDTFDAPRGATLLASTIRCRNQILSWGKATLLVQCHPEVRTRDLEKWLVGNAAELATTRSSNVRTLRADTQRYGLTLERQGKLCFGEWLDGLKLA